VTEKFERIEKHLYRRKHLTSTGDWSTLFYGYFVDWKGKRRWFPFGDNLKRAREELEKKRVQNREKFDFDAEKMKPEIGITILVWSEAYFNLEEVKQKRSLDRDRTLVAPIRRLLGDKLLTELKRDHLFGYTNDRRKEGIIRGGKESRKKVSDGTIKNELSLLRRMINLARDAGLETSAVSFRDALPQANSRERVLSNAEAARLFPLVPTWLRRLAEVAQETALSEGDLIRLTEDMIDEDQDVIVPAGGRIKTGVRQIAPLTDRVSAILGEIRAERTQSKIRNVRGLVFTRDDGRPITKDAIASALKRACRDANVRDFRFHDLRHCAKTNWARQGISTEAAMLAAGHKSFQMHQRYVHLQNQDIAKAFGIRQECSQDVHTTRNGSKAAS